MRYEEFRIEQDDPQHVERWLRGLVRLGKFCLLLLVVPVVLAALVLSLGYFETTQQSFADVL